MNKKLFMLFQFIIVVLFVGFTFAVKTSIGDVTVNFCNGGDSTKSLSMVLDSGKQGDICMEFSNYSDNDVEINYGFVDGVVTADKYKSKACKNEGDNKNFGQYVTQEVSRITIPSMSKVRQQAHIKFPAGFTGMKNGCLTYFVSNAKDSAAIDSAMFDVLVRKAAFIDVLVGGKLSRNLKLSEENKAINTYYDKDKNALILEVKLDNKGNVNEGVVITGIVSNIFGYSVVFSGDMIKVLSDSSQVLKVEIDNIPRYRGPFNIDLNINSIPKFDFDSSSIPDIMKENIVIHAKTTVFLIPWMIIYIFGGVILLFVLIKLLAKHIKFQ